MELLLIGATLFVGWLIWGKDTPSKPFQYRPKQKNTNTYTPKSESHLSLVSRCDYQTQRIMSANEFKIFRLLQKKLKNSLYVFPQVALGEVLTSKEGHSAINAKRVDLLIVDHNGHAVAAVEFNGKGPNGHCQGNYAERDAVKYTALTKAKVKFISIDSVDEDRVEGALKSHGLLQ
ncbi:TPA: DUF2726 domain-containing protein [Vibrio parahaemolyticus]|nr:DUF2726 domain-containing protein [Vibrio parahaemolyticus]